MIYRILTYISSAIFSVAVYLAFGAFMTASAGLNSISPLFSFLTSIAIFGIFSWLHFFYSLIGAWTLSIAVIFMYFTWPVFFLNTLLEGTSSFDLLSLLPLILCILSSVLVWVSHFKKAVLPKKLGLAIALPSFLFAAYVGGYFIMNYFF